MDSDMRVLYDQYLAYFQDFQTDFDRHVGKEVHARFRATVLSFSEFHRAWQRWGQQGLQSDWRQRFERGYASWAADQVSRLTAILANDDIGAMPTRRAA